MKAIAYTQALAIDQAEALFDLELELPQLRDFDVLVKIAAIAVNPVDTKVRRNMPATDAPRILGWDACGEIVALGSKVSAFKIGQRVYYAGALDRQGSNAEYQAVDSRLIALAPTSLNNAQAAALPLTSITAWEILFERLNVARKPAPATQGARPTLLITGAAGGVGSMLIQLARHLTDLRIIATASRDSSRQWCLDLGADHVINHQHELLPQLQALGIQEVDMVASLTHTSDHLEQLIACLKPQGQLAVIDDMPVLNAMLLKSKSLSLHWEMMFTRSLYQTSDMQAQGDLLHEIASLVDAGKVRTTIQQVLTPINAANLIRAHQQIESETSIGKIVLENFPA